MVIEFTEINMVHRKIKYKVVSFILICGLLLLSCKKEAKDPINVSMNAILAHNNQPVSGIKWTIKETKSTGFTGNTETTDWEKSGQTDAAGKSIIEFYPKKNLDYQYDIYFDYSSMNVSGGDYSIVSGPTTFAHVTHQGPNNYEIRILPKMDVIVHYKNISCFDVNDQFKFISRNIDEKPQTTLVDMEIGNWTDHPGNYGCIDRWGALAFRTLYIHVGS